MITQNGLNKTAQLIKDRLISHGEVTIDGSTFTTPLRRIITDDNQIRAHIYLTQEDSSGSVQEARLIDYDGDVYAERYDELSHEDNKGLLIEFRFNVIDEEVS